MRPRGTTTRTLGDLVAAFPDSIECVDSSGAPIDPAAVQSTEFSGLAIGSADVIPGDIFAAYTGLRRHGAEFAPQAVAAGAVIILTDEAGLRFLAEQSAASSYQAVPVLLMKTPEDERELVGQIASWFYGAPAEELTTVGITGTNGKTTTTYFVEAALRAEHESTALLGTVELRVADETIESPRTTVEAPVLHALERLAVERGATALVAEVSSHALALQRIAGQRFDVVGFTNLQRDHLDFHLTMENYLADKAKLFTPEHAKRGVVNVDDEWGWKLARSAEIPVETLGTLPEAAGYADADWRVSDAVIGLDGVGSTFTLHGPDGVSVAAHCVLPTRVNVSNAALAIVLAHRAGVSLEAAVAGVEAVRAIPGRMERVVDRTETQPLVIVDYAHTPDALDLVLTSIRNITPGRLVIVFGSDGDRDRGKRPIMGEIAARLADVLVVTDENPRSEPSEEIRAAILEGAYGQRPARDNIHEVAPRWDAVEYAVQLAQPQDTVIVTGKGHEPTQEVAGVFTRYNDRDPARAAATRLGYVINR